MTSIIDACPRARGRARAPAREGTTVVEVLLGLVLMALVVQGAWSIAAAQRRAVERLIESTERTSAERIVWELLREELRAGTAARDRGPVARDTVSVRAFRGFGLVCSWRPSPARLLVHYRGVREPDPAKDSVLVLGTDGGWTRAAVVEWSASALRCPADTARALHVLTTDPAPAAAVLVRVFERGSYHLGDDALRYRRGAGGRQPLTPAVLEPGAAGLAARRGGAVRVELATARGPGGAAARSWERTVWPRAIVP